MLKKNCFGGKVSDQLVGFWLLRVGQSNGLLFFYLIYVFYQGGGKPMKDASFKV